MALGLYEELAFRLLSLEYLYMWPFPVKMDFKRGKLVKIEPSFKSIPYVIGIFLICMYGQVCFSTAIYMGYLSPRVGFGRINFGIFTLVAAVFAGLGLMAYCCAQCLDALISEFNGVLKLAVDLENDIPKHKRKWISETKNFDASPFLALVIVPAGAFAPLFAAFCAQYSQFGCLHFLLEEMLPDPKYRDRSTVYMSIALTFLADYIALAETVRTCLFISCCLCMLCTRVLKLLRALTLQISSFQLFFHYYILARLLHKKGEHVVNVGLFVAMSISFWSVVFFGWICVKCQAETITLPVYMFSVFAFAGVVVGHVIVLPLICLWADMSEHVIKVHQLRARLWWSKMKSRANKINVSKAKSMLPVRLKYGAFWHIRGDFMGEYIWMIIMRCFDAILIIDFR